MKEGKKAIGSKREQGKSKTVREKKREQGEKREGRGDRRGREIG